MLSFFPRDVLAEILDLTESVSEDFSTLQKISVDFTVKQPAASPFPVFFLKCARKHFQESGTVWSYSP